MTAEAIDVPQTWKVRLDSRRRPTLPEEAMRAAGFAPGDDLRVRVLEEGVVLLETPAHILQRAKSRVRPLPEGRSVVDEFLAWRRDEADRL